MRFYLIIWLLFTPIIFAETITYGGLTIECDKGCSKSNRDADFIFYSCVAETLGKEYWPLYDENGHSHSIIPWQIEYDEDDDEDFYNGSSCNVYDWQETQGLWKGGSWTRIHYDNFESFQNAANRLREDLNFYLLNEENHYLADLKKDLEFCLKKRDEGYRLVDTDDRGILYACNSGFYATPIDTQIEQDRKHITDTEKDLEEKKDLLEQYQSKVSNAFQKIDAVFKEAFLWCLEHHQPEGIAFNAAMEYLIAGDLDLALEKIHFLISLAEKNQFDDQFVSKLYLLKGQIQSEFLLYSNAIVSLTTAIQKDPSLKDAYLERASAYFELGQFDQAIEDYVAQRDPQLLEPPTLLQHIEFGKGFLEGIGTGVHEAGSEFIPSTIASLQGMGNLLWATVAHPIETPRQLIASTIEICNTLSKCTPTELMSFLIPEAHQLFTDWENFDHFHRGQTIGHVLGKYGLDIFGPTAIAKGAKVFASFQQIKKINKCATLESLADKTKRVTTLEASSKFAHNRKHQLSKVKIEIDKQGKHNPNHKNFIRGKSEWIDPDPQKIVNELGGKGQKVRGRIGKLDLKKE